MVHARPIGGIESFIKYGLSGGSVAERLEHWTCNLEAPSSSPALTASWICSW